MAQDQLENKFVYDRNGQPTNSICLAKDFAPKSNKCYFTLSTTEGPNAWKEAVRVLSSTAPNSKPLQWSEGLAQACYDHIRDTGPRGVTGHSGSDGSSSAERMQRYVDATMYGENLAYSDAETGYDMMLQLLIDDGVPNRGHRTNILEPEFTHAGVSCGCHKVYTEMCCFAYGKDVREKNPSKKADVAPQLKKCSPYSPSTKGTTSQNFNVGNVDTPKKNEAGPAQPTVNPDQVPYSTPGSISNFDDIFPGLFGNDFGSFSGASNPSGFGDHSNVGQTNMNGDWGIEDWSWDSDNWFDDSWAFDNWGEDLNSRW